MARSWEDRCKNYKSSLDDIKLAYDLDINSRVTQIFIASEFSMLVEHGWKLLKSYIENNYRDVKFVKGSPKDIVKIGGELGIVDSDTWVSALNLRNLLAHDYQDSIADTAKDSLSYVDTFDALFSFVAGDKDVKLPFDKETAKLVYSMFPSVTKSGDMYKDILNHLDLALSLKATLDKVNVSEEK